GPPALHDLRVRRGGGDAAVGGVRGEASVKHIRRRRNIRALSGTRDTPYGEGMAADELLYQNDKKEALSRAFASAVAAAAGYCTAPPADFDRDSVDMTFTASGPRRPKLDAQLKASSSLAAAEDHFKFPLPKKN